MPIKLLPACSYYKLLHEQALQSQIVTLASALSMVMCPYNITMLTGIFSEIDRHSDVIGIMELILHLNE